VASALAAALVLMPLVPLWQTWFGKIGSFRDLVSKNMSTVADLMQRKGPAAVTSAVRAMASGMPDDSIILFAGPGKEILAGTLGEWPANIPDVPLRAYGVPTNIESLRPLIIVSQEILPGGYRVLMARKAVPQRLIEEQLMYGVAGTLAVLIVLGAGAAWLLARRAAAVRLSEERYARVVLSSNSGLWDWDVVHDKYYVSPRFLAMNGFPPDTVFAGRDDFMRRNPMYSEDGQRYEEYEQAVRDLFAGTGSRLATEVRVLVNGEVRWRRLEGICFRDARGKVVRWTGSATDITDRKRAEEALRLSEERYALAMEASEVGHFDWNVQTDEIFASDRLKVLLGLPLEFIFRTRSEMLSRVALYALDAERVIQFTRDVLASGATHHEFEYRWDRGSGTLQWNRVRWKIFRREDGAAVRVVGTVSDVTERRNAVDELRESEARFRGLTKLWSDWYWRQDEQLRFTYSSAAIDPPSGYPGGSAIGKTRWELPGIVPISCSWAEHRELLAARKPFRDFEYSRPAADGSIRYISSSGTPIFNDKGEFAGYHGVGRDVSERRRVEEELRSRKELLELAQKSARAVAYEWKIHASKGENRWSNDLEAMYGLPPGSFDGSVESWKKLLYPEDRALVRKAIRQAWRTGDIDLEFRVVHPDASVHWLQSKGRMFLDPDGKPDRMVGFIQEVTQRKLADEALRKMEQELRRAQRLEAMGTLAGGIAHDFNNILGAILGYSEMAMRNARQGSRLRRDLDAITSAVDRGRSLVERILAFSRSGVGERVAVHVEAVVREALHQVAARLPDGVTISPRLRAGRAAMLGDATQVHQVVVNLASNAIQAMPLGGVLHVALDRKSSDTVRAATVGSIVPGDYIVLTVTDSGTGIPDHVLEHMFDPFFTTKEVGVGSGLGLSLVHGIVTNADGAIDVATTLGKGTTFTVYLRRSGDAPESPAIKTRRLPRGRGQRVLVVDDEEPLLRLATETLEGLGYIAVPFTSSVAALAAFRADPAQFDVVLTDERMPGLTGSALIREMRSIRDAVPVLLMSGYLGMESVDADVVLRKPLSARDLAASMAEVIQL